MLQRLLRDFGINFERKSLLKPSVIALIAANIFPFFGVILLDWDVFLLLALFWIENLIVGFFTILKMLLVANGKDSWSAKFSLIPFFCLHYGIFALVHGVFVFVIFGGYFSEDSSFPNLASAWQKAWDFGSGWGGLVLFASHGFSFFFNYLGSGEYKRSDLKTVMTQPYSRVVILHVTIIFGGFLVAFLGSPIFGLLFLIVLKTAIDVLAHLREHGKFTLPKAVEVQTD